MHLPSTPARSLSLVSTPNLPESPHPPATSAAPAYLASPSINGTPQPHPKNAIDPEAYKHMQQTIATLEQQLRDSQARVVNKDIDMRRTEDKLQQVMKEKDVLVEQLSIAREESSAKVSHLDKEIADRNAQIARLTQGTVDRVTWANVTRAGSVWNQCITQLTGIQDANVLQCLFDWLNWDGVADRMKYWNGKATINRITAEAAGTTQRSSSGKPSKRSFTSQNALLATLVKLRTGLGTKVISSLTGIPVGNLSRIFTTWISHMDNWFSASFPIPTTADLEGRVSSEWTHAYGTAMIRFILDCTEFRTQQPAGRKAARTLWSEYKHCHTVKFLAAICPAGAYVGSTTAYPGRITDTEIFLESEFYRILQRGDCIPADKGFDQLIPYVSNLGARLVAPARRPKGRKTYTADERSNNEGQSNLRIHVERHFSRGILGILVQNWGVFSQKKISLYCIDMIGKTFNVVSHLCNLQQSLCKNDSQIDDEEEGQ